MKIFMRLVNHRTAQFGNQDCRSETEDRDLDSGKPRLVHCFIYFQSGFGAINPSAPLFPSFGKNRETIELRRLDRRSILKLVEKRARTSGILKRVCCHSFRATGVTEYMNSGGTIEIAQRIAGHTSPSTTRIYDRSGDQLALQEIERVQIGKKQEN